MTRSPLCSSVRATSAIALCEPLVTTICSGLVGTPAAE